MSVNWLDQPTVPVCCRDFLIENSLRISCIDEGILEHISGSSGKLSFATASHIFNKFSRLALETEIPFLLNTSCNSSTFNDVNIDDAIASQGRFCRVLRD